MKRIMLLVLASTFSIIALAAEDNAATKGSTPDGTETTGKVSPQGSTPGPEGDVAPGDLPQNAPSGNLKETVSRSLLLFTPSEEIDVDRPVDFPTNI